MALKSPLMPSPTFQSAFSPYTDSPNSPAPFRSIFSMSNRSSNASERDTLHPPPSPYPATVDPSPVDSQKSTSSEATEIDDSQEDVDEEEEDAKSPDVEIISPATPASQTQDSLAKINTVVPLRTRSDPDDDPASVIHAPAGFKQFNARKSSPTNEHSSPSTSDTTGTRVTISPVTPDSNAVPDDKAPGGFASPINTSVSNVTRDLPTPRASTRQDAEEEWKRRSRASRSLEDIAEAEDAEKAEDLDVDIDHPFEGETMGQALENLNNADQGVKALRSALSECWTLCNTLANLSSIHRERMFSIGGSGEVQEQAWRSCWKLCQRLYESRDEDPSTQVRPTLELCRDFCQALFEARQRGDEASDSVLRVSFELNNHLYNTHDRNLPEAFRERTLDFYWTLCHRLMRQRTSLPEETDALLRACWSLAEMLFSLQQNNRDSKSADEELLSSAVQACWDLCDLFREGWTQIRPDRGTPRPSQTTFPTSFVTASSSSQRVRSPPSVPSRSSSSLSHEDTYHSAQSLSSLPPETPTTIFDDTASLSPDEPNMPNILVLGPDTGATSTSRTRWSSAASNLSGYSESSQRTSSTARNAAQQQQQQSPKQQQQQQQQPEDPHLARLKALILKAAMNAGYARNAPQTLPAFVKALPRDAFGGAAWQVALLEQYKKLVVADPTLRERGSLPAGARMSAAEVARAVQWMGRSEQFGWLRDLYRVVFGFAPEEAEARKGVGMQT